MQLRRERQSQDHIAACAQQARFHAVPHGLENMALRNSEDRTLIGLSSEQHCPAKAHEHGPSLWSRLGSSHHGRTPHATILMLLQALTSFVSDTCRCWMGQWPAWKPRLAV